MLTIREALQSVGDLYHDLAPRPHKLFFFFIDHRPACLAVLNQDLVPLVAYATLHCTRQ